MSAKSLWSATKEVFREFFEDQPFLLAAALSYYTLLSMAPLLIVIIAVAGFVLGEEAARGELVHQIEEYVGAEGAQAIQMVLANASGPGKGVIPMVVGIVTLLLGATTVFAQLQTSLNEIWDVKASPKSSAVWTYVRTRLLSLGLILAVGFLLLVSLVVSAVLAGVQGYLSRMMPGMGWLWQALNIVVSLGVITVLLAMIFKYLPDVEIQWRDVWVGAGITAVLFTVGKYLIGLYLGQASVGSAYGAAGSLVVLLVWVYYSALILFFGAEVTQVYARRTGSQIQPAAHAVRAKEEGGGGEA